MSGHRNFAELMSMARQQAEKGRRQGGAGSPSVPQVSRPKKEDPKQAKLKEGVAKFLAKREEENRRRKEEEKLKKERLLQLRNQDRKATNRVRKMLSMTKSANKSCVDDAKDCLNASVAAQDELQPDNDDYGYTSNYADIMHKKMMESYKAIPVAKPATGDTHVPVPKPQSLATNGKGWRGSGANKMEDEDDDASALDQRAQAPQQQHHHHHHTKQLKKPRKVPQKPPPPDYRELLQLAQKKSREPVPLIAKIPVRGEEKRENFEFGRPMTAKEKAAALAEKELRERSQRLFEMPMDRRGNRSSETPPLKSVAPNSSVSFKIPKAKSEKAAPPLPPPPSSPPVAPSPPKKLKQVEPTSNLTLPMGHHRTESKMNAPTPVDPLPPPPVIPAAIKTERKSHATKPARETQSRQHEQMEMENSGNSTSTSRSNHFERKPDSTKMLSSSSTSVKPQASTPRVPSPPSTVLLKRDRDVPSPPPPPPSTVVVKKEKTTPSTVPAKRWVPSPPPSTVVVSKTRIPSPPPSTVVVPKIRIPSPPPSTVVLKTRFPSPPPSTVVVPKTRVPSPPPSTVVVRREPTKPPKQPVPSKSEEKLKIKEKLEQVKEKGPRHSSSYENQEKVRERSHYDQAKAVKEKKSKVGSSRRELPSTEALFNSPEGRSRKDYRTVSPEASPPPPPRKMPPPQSPRPAASGARRERERERDRRPPSAMKPVMRREPSPKLKPKSHKGRAIIDSDDEDEYDSEMDDFIDDSEVDMDNISAEISRIFKYDRRKYAYADESDDECMESSVAQQMREEQRSLRIGIQEDLEDIRREEEEKRRKLLKMKKRR